MNINNNEKNESNYNSEPGIKFRPRHIILGIIIILFFITSFCIVAYNICKESNIENSISSMINSSKNSISNLFNSDDSSKSNKDKTSSSKNSNKKKKDSSSDNKTSSSSDNSSGPVNLSTLSIEDYAKYCTDKTFGKHSYNDGTCFSHVNFMHNNYTVYINIGLHRNRDDLNDAAVNASVELYKALYTLCPEKFGNTLFGVYVSGSYIDKNGNKTESDEVMFSWFDEKTLKATDINTLNSDNLQNVIYRYFNPYKGISIQKD